jgi:glyoxylase-like metal-dependent hydrolase (beta-lactamase superfamily II)
LSQPAAPPVYEDLEPGITAVDTGFERPFFDASHLIVANGRAAFVDVGTNFSAPALLAALEHKGLARDAVDYVILTHVHLDHAGGAGELLRHLPGAKLVVHPRGARHMIDPTALMNGASDVYGADVVARTYGRLVPVDAARVVEAPEGFVLDVGGRALRFLDTPGHARHHVCIWDEAARAFFTGDTFGLSYREFASARGAFIIPTTTPVQFDPGALRASIERLLSHGPRAMFLTHYSRVTEVERLARDLVEQIDAHVALARAADGHSDRHARLTAALEELYLGRARDHGSPLAPERARELLALDVELNAQGLEVWLDRGKR